MEDEENEDEENDEDEDKDENDDEDDDEEGNDNENDHKANDNGEVYENEVCTNCDQIFTIHIQPSNPHAIVRKRSRENSHHCELCQQKQAKRQRFLYQYDPTLREELNKLTQHNLNRAVRPSSDDNEGDW